MPPKFTPRPPQAGRYWPGKPLQEDEESSSDDYDEEEEDEERQGEVITEDRVERVEDNSSREEEQGYHAAVGKVITTVMKSTKIPEPGPYLQEEESSSESESEEEEEKSLHAKKQVSKIRKANRRAVGDFVAVDRVNLEEEEEVKLYCLAFY